MRRIATRMNFIIFILVLQIAAFVFFAGWVVHSHPVFYYTSIFTSVVVFLFVLKRNEASVYKITWIIIILVAPSVGGIIYLFFGNKRPVKRIAAHMREHALIAKLLDADGNLPFIREVRSARMYSLMRYIRHSSSYHAYIDTEQKYYGMGEPLFADMLKEISCAKKFIFVESFIIKSGKMWDTLLEALENKAADGVEVRLIVDHLGSHKLFTRAYIKKLRAKNINVLRFNPMSPFLLLFMNNRDHRKVLVVDGETAFTGGINIADEYINLIKPFGVWKDSGIRLRGDAVWSFTLMFIEMWDTFCEHSERINDYELYRAECPSRRPSRRQDESPQPLEYVIPYGDTPLNREQMGENIYVDIINQSERYVYIFTPYLIISEKLVCALQLAAKRGVDIRIVTPGIPDKKLVFRLTRSYYRDLLEAGVRIYEYSFGFLHSKSIVCDDNIAVVGTINFDYRSLYLHFECAVLLYECGVIRDIRDDVLGAIGESCEVALGERRQLGSELIDSVLHLFAPLM